MATRHRALVAAQPAAWTVLLAMLDEVIDLVPVHTMADALRALEHEGSAIDLIVSTIAFDDSQMIDLLQTVKRDPLLKRIPFLCSRILRSVLSEQLLDGMRDVCMQCQAVDFLDVANLPRDEAQSIFRAAVMRYVEAGKAP